MKKLILIIGLLLITGIVVWRISFKDAEVSVKKEKTAYQLTATELLKQYETNETSANEKYLNKVITISGNIGKIETTSEGLNIYLQETGETSGVICGFDQTIASESDFSLGNPITIKGLCTGYLFDVVLVKCMVVD